MTTDAPAPPTPAALVAWAAGQTAAFHKALAAAVETYAATGVAPKSITAGGAGGAAADGDGKKTRAKKDKDAPKRPPTPYNIFVKERAAVLKEKGFDPKAEHTSELDGGERGRRRHGSEPNAARREAKVGRMWPRRRRARSATQKRPWMSALPPAICRATAVVGTWLAILGTRKGGERAARAAQRR